MTIGPVVIIGAGHAGFQVATSLRQHGFSERIALVNDESHLPYQRPPLSKAYLKGTGGPDSLMFRPEKFYHDQKVDLISDRAISIDRAACKVALASGASLDYGHLVLATGARNRLLDIPNANLDSVRYLRTLDESQSLRDYIAPGQRVIVIGAGFIGLEFAATARAKGLEVDVIGVGVLPNVELALEAGLPVAAGIVVDEHLLTADPNISAVGDCALYASPRFGGSLRLESVQNATDHARCVAARLTGDAKPYDGLPWFWSDQGPDKLQMVGLTTGYDRVVVRGDRAQGAFSAFCYKAGQLVGIESVNRAGAHMFGRRLLAAHRSITPEQAADAGFDLKGALT
jgi:3-phenylpropionate/trans-cinnamate dioxygenase ferredoxin reductase subunit